MGIQIGQGKVKRDWGKLASAAAETVAQALALGKDGFSAAVSAFFRVIEGLRGEDSVELRATRLVLETLAYAISATIATAQLGRRPLTPEVQHIISNMIANATQFAKTESAIFESEHLANPQSFPIFANAASGIFTEIRLCSPKENEPNVIARFRGFIAEGLNRIRTRDPQYFSTVVAALTGPDAVSNTRVRAWDSYRALLIQRFEDEPLFGEDKPDGVRLGQVYQPLRAWWDLGDDESDPEGLAKLENATPNKKVHRHVGMLDELVLNWLKSDNPLDRIRLVSGGPGSGKSTFAKRLAALLAPEPRWRIVFVPLQRLKGTGALETRIDEYFRLQLDEPFDAETAPLSTLGRDEHRDWLIIFDGLDELAKEGASSESAAQDFASALADWRGRTAAASVRFLVLGRAPSMQEARRRLGLYGKGTLYVADMIPLKKQQRNSAGREVAFVDPNNLGDIDQRADYWRRWASAKGLSLEPPEAMKVDALVDLTKEPLLAYLLIFSGYVGERWHEAADNRNHIYQAIFNEIWNRERSKPTRIHLNDLGQEGFESLMQSLGLAAWRGGGRTGDEATFTSVRDTFMQPGLLAKAKECGAADLSNVALLFYTRKDEEGGRGYEFLHKSFGEYLTARGLMNAFKRWGSQVDDPELDFNTTEFLRRWLRLAGPAPMTKEILTFLRNEARLQAAALKPDCKWQPAREWIRVAEHLVDEALRDGLPAHERATKWRSAETQERNAEVSLMGLLDACARTAYPFHLLGAPTSEGGWEPGPVHIPIFKANNINFIQFLIRDGEMVGYNWMMTFDYFVFASNSILLQMLSRLSLRHVYLIGESLSGSSFEGADLRYAVLTGSSFAHANFGGVDLKNSQLRFANFMAANLAQCRFA